LDRVHTDGAEPELDSCADHEHAPKEPVLVEHQRALDIAGQPNAPHHSDHNGAYVADLLAARR